MSEFSINSSIGGEKMAFSPTLLRRFIILVSLYFLFLSILYSPAMAYYMVIGDGGGYSGDTITVSTGQIADSEMVVGGLGSKYRFTKKTNFAFPLLKELQWTLPKSLLSEKNTSTTAIVIKEVKSHSPKDIFMACNPRVRGDAVMTLDETGVATVMLNEETPEIIQSLLKKSESIAQEMTDINQNVVKLKESLKEIEKSVSDNREDVKYISGFVYGVIAILGTGFVGVLFGFVYKRLSKKAHPVEKG